MLSGIFSRKKGKTELAVVLDIGSASIGGALVQLSYNEKPLIIYTTRKDMTFASEVDPERLLESMKKTLKSVLLDVQKSGFKSTAAVSLGKQKVEAVYCTFSAPWYLAEPKQVSHMYKEQKTIDSKFVEKILHSEEEVFINDAIKEYASKDKDDLYLLENVLINVEIDGYDVRKLSGQKTQDLELSILSTMIPSRVADAVIDTVSSVLHVKDLHLHSFALVSFGVVRDVFDKENFLLLDISGEVTEVNLVHEGKLLESGTFPFGLHTFARKLSKSLNSSTEEVLSKLSMKQDEESSILVFEDTEKQIIDEVENQWCKEFVGLVNEFAKEHSLSPNIVFIGDEKYSEFFKGLFHKEVIIDSISYGFKPNVTVLDRDITKPYVYNAKDSKEDVFLAIETVFFNTSHDSYHKRDLATFHN